MPLGLLRYGLAGKYPASRYFPPQSTIKPRYDVAIIGGGGHGLATAYYLAKDWGIRNVCVLEKGWLASGNTARNTTIVRSNYLTPEGATFYEESRQLYENLAGELGINLMYSDRGHLTLAHTDAAMRTSRWRAEVNKHLGIDTELGLSGGAERTLSGVEPLCSSSLPDSRCALPSARCYRAPRRRSMGLRQACDAVWC